MATMKAHLARSCVLVAMAVSSGCTPPSDPVLIGRLCAMPQEDCDDRAILQREVVQGRNAIDFEVVNTSSAAHDVIVRVGPAAVFEEVFDDDDTPDRITEEEDEALAESDFYFKRAFSLPAGARATDRLTSDELGRESRLWFSMACEGEEACDVVLDYVLIVDPLECASREDCLSGWECDVERGRCLECIPGQNMCATEQTCELGRCTPPAQSTCHTTPGALPHIPSALLLCAGLLGLGRIRRRLTIKRANS